MCQTDSESKTETNTHVRKNNNKLINENNLHFVIVSESLSCVWTTAQEPCKLKVHRTHRISIHVYVCMHACMCTSVHKLAMCFTNFLCLFGLLYFILAFNVSVFSWCHDCNVCIGSRVLLCDLLVHFHVLISSFE